MIDQKKIQKYLKGLNNFGLYPTLKLLKEYEDEQNFEECEVVFIAIKQKIKEEVTKYRNNNGRVYTEKDFPTHIRQFSDSNFREMFDVFGLKAHVTIKNSQKYIDAIKRLEF